MGGGRGGGGGGGGREWYYHTVAKMRGEDLFRERDSVCA